VHVISYKSADAILAEVFTNEGTGTLVVADVGKLAPAELAAGSGAGHAASDNPHT
jgi:acetylglutamate kinase